MAFEPQPLEQTAGTANAFFAPKPVALDIDLPAPELPEIPTEGTYFLKSVDGELTWVEDAG